MSLPEYYQDDETRFLLPEGVGVSTEDVERYRPGGFHPVHLGDRYDGGRYRIVHKLGAGGFSTVWLARDEREEKWVALKIVAAEQSTFVGDKSLLSRRATSNMLSGDDAPGGFIAEHHRQFTFEGPNGLHLCLVLPVLGPSASDLSSGFASRVRPWLARKVGYEATKAVADLHSQGLCHGGELTLSDLDRFAESDIYNLFGPPATGELKTESGEVPGPEAPRYIVKMRDFLSYPVNIIITHDIKLVDFDQCFPASSPPENMLGTPLDFLAPEVAAGFAPSPASDVWALGCCLFRLRSGASPFENRYQVTTPQTLWDQDGQPTRDPGKGKTLWKWEDERPLKDLVYQIWNEPNGRAVQTGTSRPKDDDLDGDGDGYGEDRNPFPPCFSYMVWKPTAVKVDNIYLPGYNQESLTLLEAMPKIPEDEADLLFDLLSKIFVYDPKKRPTAREVLSHPWFHMDDYDSRDKV